VSPAAPVCPTCPATPVKPLSPVSPMGPGVPLAPTMPTAPVTPVAPVLPVRPRGPVSPATPFAPLQPNNHTSRYPHLLLSAGACSTALDAIDRHLLPAGRTAANPPSLLIDGTDRQTDGRKDTRPLHRPCIAYYSGSINNTVNHHKEYSNCIKIKVNIMMLKL